MERLHAILRPYQQYYSYIGQCEGDIMKGKLQLNKLPPPVGLKPKPLGQQACTVNSKSKGFLLEHLI